MTVEEILRSKPALRFGYEPYSVSTTTLEPVGCGFLRKLRTIPAKITAYFDRAKISEVFKTKYGNPEDAYYIVRATDGTLFHVDY